MKRWRQRFLSSTRGKVVQLLRRGQASVSELAGALGLTDNAVRSHLQTLERDGLVHTSGKRPGTRKPETLYALTRDADQLFPQAYHLLLRHLLDAVERRMPPEEMDVLLREVGRDLAAAHGVDRSRAQEANPSDDVVSAADEGRSGRSDAPASGRSDVTLRQRVERATAVLEELGGLADIRENGDILIQGHSCPLASTVEHHPDVCRLAESLLAEVIQAPVREMCDRSGRPRCAFLVEREES